MKRTLLLLIISATFFGGVAYSQKKINLPVSVDSLATGNYKDVLNSFFQLAVDKFTGPDKEIKFTSNPFAVMAKLDTGLLIDTEYYKYRRLRNFNFSVSAKLDSSYKFNGFSSGLKYAIINKRDETVSRVFLDMVAHDNKTQELFALNFDLDAYIAGLSNNIPLQDKIRLQKTQFFRGEVNFNQLDPSFREKIIQLAKQKDARYLLKLIETDGKFNMKKTSQKIYDDLKHYFNNKLLWTIGVSDTTYKDQFLFSNIVITSEVVKAIDSLKNADVELNVKAALQYVDDTLKTGRDLKRSVFSFEPGVNFVLKTKGTGKSFFEFKLSGGYYYTFSALYQNEQRSRITLNGAARIRIINDIWVPVEIRYDPKSGNVFGFLNVRANFTGLGKLVKSIGN